MEGPPKSMELWAASKIIGRECASESRAYIECRVANGTNPVLCATPGDGIINCTMNVLKTVKTKFPEKFESFQKCLDQNDYRFEECRPTEKAFLDSWNQLNGLTKS